MSNITQFTTGGVKSVQRGTYVGTIYNAYNAITISTINPAKAIVTVNGGYAYGGYSSIFPYLISLTATVLTVQGPHLYSGSWAGIDGSWQVVEYY
jgi:hypothetical protein